jgi:hypothetical protein
MNWRSKINRRLVVTSDGAVERRSVDKLGDALIPFWMRPALESAEA